MMNRPTTHRYRNFSLVALWLCMGTSCRNLLKDRTDLGTCGDGIVQSSLEECDPAANNGNIKCSDHCTKIECGNGVLDPGEECDDGKANDNSGDCTEDCRNARCGDGYLKTHGKSRGGPYPYEVCDDGNDANGDGCNPQCNLKGQVSVVVGQPGGKGTTDGAGTSAQFASVASLALSEDGKYLYALDHDSCTLREVDLSTWEVRTRVGAPGECFTLNGVGSAARLSKNYQPITVANSKLYLGANDVLQAIDLRDWSVTSCARVPDPHPSDTQINALAFDPDDPSRLYAGTRHAIYSMALPCKCASALALSNCTLEPKLGDPLSSAGWQTTPRDGVGTDARLEYVMGLAADASANTLYVGDLYYVRHVDLTTWQVTTVAGSNDKAPKDGPGPEAAFSLLYQMAYDRPNKRLYIIDLQLETAGNELIPSWSTVRTYDPPSSPNQVGEVGTLAGVGGSLRLQPSGELDGFGNSSRFLNARGLAVTASRVLVGEDTSRPVVLVGDDASIRLVSTATRQVTTPVGTLVREPLFWSAKDLTKASVTVSDAKESEIVVATHFGDLMAMRVDGGGPVRTLPSCGGGISRHIEAVTASGSHVYAFDGMSGGICRIDLDRQIGGSCDSGTRETCEWVFKEPIAKNWTVGGLAYDGTYFYVSDKLEPALWRINESTGERVAISVALTNSGWIDALAYVPKSAATGGESEAGVPQSGAAGTGWLYATSSFQNQVLRIDLDTSQVHFIGSGIAAHRDGSPENSAFCHPTGLTTDGTRLFVGDTNCDLTAQNTFQGHAIRQIDNIGGPETVTTLLGPGPSHLVASVGAQASVNYPIALTYDDKTGALLGVDNFDNVIFKVQ
jgi:cysteine-rich repeat protein